MGACLGRSYIKPLSTVHIAVGFSPASIFSQKSTEYAIPSFCLVISGASQWKVKNIICNVSYTKANFTRVCLHFEEKQDIHVKIRPLNMEHLNSGSEKEIIIIIMVALFFDVSKKVT